MKIIVLGAGIVGTASAWFLRKAGHEVGVSGSQSGAAQEPGLANACRISFSQAVPWGHRSAPLKILKWLREESAFAVPLPRRMAAVTMGTALQDDRERCCSGASFNPCR